MAIINDRPLETPAEFNFGDSYFGRQGVTAPSYLYDIRPGHGRHIPNLANGTGRLIAASTGNPTYPRDPFGGGVGFLDRDLAVTDRTFSTSDRVRQVNYFAILGVLFLEGYQKGSATQTWEYGSGDMSHDIGEATGDDDWLTNILDGSGRHTYGPYETIASGTYVASFRLKIDNNTADNARVATVDVRNHTTSTVETSMDIYRGDFDEAGEYQDFELQFTSNGTDEFEYRTYVYNQAEIVGEEIRVGKDETIFTTPGLSIGKLQYTGSNWQVYHNFMTKPTFSNLGWLEPGRVHAFLLKSYPGGYKLFTDTDEDSVACTPITPTTYYWELGGTDGPLGTWYEGAFWINETPTDAECRQICRDPFGLLRIP